MKKALISFVLLLSLMTGCSSVADSSSESSEPVTYENMKFKIVGYNVGETGFNYTSTFVSIVYKGKIKVITFEGKVMSDISSIADSYLYAKVSDTGDFKELVIKSE